MDYLRIFKNQGEGIDKDCFAKGSCPYFSSNGICINRKVYTQSPCYVELLNQGIAKNSKKILGSQVDVPSKKQNDKPFTEEENRKLARATGALFNGGNLFAA